jgi:hypothetical protein
LNCRETGCAQGHDSGAIQPRMSIGYCAARSTPICPTATDQVRDGHQPQDRQGARPLYSGNAVGHRRRGDPVRRRQFIAGLGAAVWPIPSPGQNAAPPVVGFVGAASADAYVRAFRKGLGETGYGDDRNATIEYHWFGGPIRSNSGVGGRVCSSSCGRDRHPRPQGRCGRGQTVIRLRVARA